MAQYYYFAAQLPLLRFGERSFFSCDSFREEAQKWFCPKDVAVLEGIDLDSFSLQPQDPPLMAQYKGFESALRREIAQYRRERKDQGEYKFSGDLSGNVLEGNPLEKEKKLLRIHWDFIDEIAQGHYFDLAFFIAYFLKLQILERLEVFNKEHGKEKFTQICEVTL